MVDQLEGMELHPLKRLPPTTPIVSILSYSVHFKIYILELHSSSDELVYIL